MEEGTKQKKAATQTPCVIIFFFFALSHPSQSSVKRRFRLNVLWKQKEVPRNCNTLQIPLGDEREITAIRQFDRSAPSL